MRDVEETNRCNLWYAIGPLIVAGLFSVACGSSGATFGENQPGDPQNGGGTYVDDAVTVADGVAESGTIAVDPDTETAFAVQKITREGKVSKRLVAVDPPARGSRMRVVGDVTVYDDIRVVFPAHGVLVMAERDGNDELFFYDDEAKRLERHVFTHARYNGTRLSPDGRWVVVGDNNQANIPIHIIDTETYETRRVEAYRGWVEAMWLHDQNLLETARFTEDEDGQMQFVLREWDPAQIFAGNGQVGPEITYQVGDIDPTLGDVLGGESFLAPTWIAISPDDETVAVSVAEADTGQPVVIVADRTSHDLHFVRDARGPVGFTPDGKTLVTYSVSEEDGSVVDAKLKLVDTTTYEEDLVDIPKIGVPTFWVAHDGNDIVVASADDGDTLVVFDLDAGRVQKMGGVNEALGDQPRQLVHLGADDPENLGARFEPSPPTLGVSPSDVGCATFRCQVDLDSAGLTHGLDLSEFVSRSGHHQLWLVSDHKLYVLDYETASLSRVPLSWRPTHVSILPQRDLLVLDGVGEESLFFFDPSSRTMVGRVSMAW